MRVFNGVISGITVLASAYTTTCAAPPAILPLRVGGLGGTVTHLSSGLAALSTAHGQPPSLPSQHVNQRDVGYRLPPETSLPMQTVSADVINHLLPPLTSLNSSAIPIDPQLTSHTISMPPGFVEEIEHSGTVSSGTSPP